MTAETEERRQYSAGRRQDKDRRQTDAQGQYPAYTGVERRVGDRRSGMNRRTSR